MKKNEKHLDIFKDEKAIEAIMSIKEVFIDKFLERGDIRLLVLNSLSESPKHGYQIMTDISKLFCEVYKPSPGVIYPTLQALSEEDLVSCDNGAKKKIYAISKKGEKELGKNKKRLDGIISEFEAACSGDQAYAKRMDGIISIWVELAYNVFFAMKENSTKVKDPEKRVKRIEKVLKNTVEEVKEVWK